MMLAQLTIQFNTDTQTDLRSSYIMAECCKVLLPTTLREYRAEVCPSKMGLRHPNIEVIPDNWTQKFEPHGGQIS